MGGFRPSWVVLAAVLGCAREPASPSPPAYGDALAGRIAGLEAESPKNPPVELPDAERAEIAQLFEAYLATLGTRLQRYAREDVLVRGDRAAPVLFIEASKPDRETRERGAAADLLGELPGEAALEAALRIAAEGDDDLVRAAVARALGRRGERRAIPPLALRLKYEKSPLAAAHLVGSLAALGNLSGLHALLALLDRGDFPDAVAVGLDIARLLRLDLPEDPTVEALRAAIAAAYAGWLDTGLSSAGPPSPDPALELELLRLVRALGEWSLRTVDDARFVLARCGTEALPALRLGLRDRDRFVRSRSIEVLGWLGKVATPAVEELLESARDPDHRAETFVALGRIGDRRATKDLVAALSDPSPEVRIASARALRALGEPAALPALREVLAKNGPSKPDALPDLALAAAAGLAEMGDLEGLPALVRLLEGPPRVDPSELAGALDAAFARLRQSGGDDAGYGEAETREAKEVAARRWLEARGSR